MDSLKLTPKNLGPIIANRFITEGDTVTGFVVTFEVNYGTHSLTWDRDIWNDLTATQKKAVQALYDKERQLLSNLVAASV
ncbi:MAG TPA: hypothetical protein G4O01_02880 [Dehalococcoidia bacterium]|jgi:hypothetical protein|nr:hypothetical protein [Dehalococcoidia bacterium]